MELKAKRRGKGNKGWKIMENLMAKLPTKQTNRHGITVNDSLCMKGTKDIVAIRLHLPLQPCTCLLPRVFAASIDLSR